MIKRSPQEIADFCQGYVFNSCSALSWVITPDKPKIVNGEWTWDHDSILWFTLPVYALNIPADHDWTHLYEPRKSIKSENSVLDTRNQPETAENSVITSETRTNQQGANYQKPTDSDNKPGHLGEVYTHKEYKVLCYTDEASLSEAVTSLMADGWEPQGSVTMVYMGEDYSSLVAFSQAMVRGV